VERAVTALLFPLLVGSLLKPLSVEVEAEAEETTEEPPLEVLEAAALDEDLLLVQ
jgi:hypothetical protein